MNNPQLHLSFINPIKPGRSNYLLWKTQVLSSIRANAVENLIDGSTPPPSRLVVQTNGGQGMTSLINPDYQIWMRQDQALLSWQLSSMTEPILGTITGCHTSCELWTALKRSFSSQTKAKALQLRMKLQSTKKGSLSITDYYNSMKNIADSLTAAGNFITDEELVRYILGGLGSDYDSVVVNITARATMSSIEEIYSLLLTHESRIEQVNNIATIDLGSPAANYAYRNNSSGNFKAPNRNNQRGRGRFGGGRNNSKPTCQVCSKYGHSAFVCYYRFDR